jgi:2-polyprenyl-3-methyl-5-hydroxy-6-metoxy-1,4-benzoquinol methylase
MIVHKECPVCKSTSIVYALTAIDHTVSGKAFEVWECGNCTLRFTQNIPSLEQIGAYYKSDEYISHSDTSKGFINNLYHRVRKITLKNKRRLVEEFTGKQKASLLDIGAGTGAFLNTMKLAGWTVSGLEPDEIARQNAQANYNITLEDLSAFQHLPFDSYDAVTMWHVLEHVHDLHGYMQRLKQVLKKDGRIFIAVPNYTSHDANAYKHNWAAYDVPRHLYHFSPKAMKTLLDLRGLKLMAIKPMWFDSFYVSMLSEQYKNGKPNNISAVLTGMVSNVKAVFGKEKCSSLIYAAGKG